LGVFSGVSLTEALSLSKKEGLRERGAAGEREKERGGKGKNEGFCDFGRKSL
jgi:hypothetical protein